MCDLNRFIQWITENAAALRQKSSRQAADQIGDEILRIDDRLGIEIAKGDEGGERTAIITAFSDPEAFPLVFRLVSRLSGIPGWHFIALKPPRGFAFRLKIGRDSIEAKALRFAPISEIPGAFRLFIPGEIPTGKQAEEMAWLIVETGIGEKLAGCVQHLELAQIEEATDSKLIEELGEFIRLNIS